MNLGEDYRVSQVCRVLELPRSSYYYQAETDTDQRTELEAALQRLAAQWPRYGYRRLTVHLHREGYQVNSKRVRVLMAHLGLTHRAKPRRVHTRHLPAQLWSLSQSGRASGGGATGPGLGGRCDIHSLAEGVCVPGSADGCVYALHAGLASGTDIGAGVNLDGSHTRFQCGLS